MTVLLLVLYGYDGMRNVYNPHKVMYLSMGTFYYLICTQCDHWLDIHKFSYLHTNEVDPAGWESQGYPLETCCIYYYAIGAREFCKEHCAHLGAVICKSEHEVDELPGQEQKIVIPNPAELLVYKAHVAFNMENHGETPEQWIKEFEEWRLAR